MSGTERLNAALAGRYKIEKQLGQGGMATVYLAHDEKHDRKVAVKVLKPELAAVLGAERFVVEIKTTAALQHPHILPLFDSGTADGFLYYVMPYIEGETLRDKLNRETQFSVDEAVRITTQVADALDYAHRHGVIHRDIKPENILLHDGRPMVADFGIALAVSAAAGGRMTETGLSLGTPHYMSPEQATAEKEITGRSDIYSLASVLYEMLAGEPPHMGGSAQQIIMKIITETARPVMALRKSAPEHVSAALARALEKLPADRFESAKAFADALGNATFAAGTGKRATVRGTASSNWRERIAVPALALTAVLALVSAFLVTRKAPPAPISRYQIELPEGKGISGANWSPLAVSPDGSSLVYMGETGRLFLRTRDALEPVELPGTEQAFNPFFSHDGKRVGFMAGAAGNADIKIAALAGGPPTAALAGTAGGPGAAFGYDGFIYYDASGVGPLKRIREAGGQPEDASVRDSAAGELQHNWPDPLPNGRAVLFIIDRSGPGVNVTATNDVAVLDLRTRTHKVLMRGVYARYTKTGHILYVTFGGDLMAVPFDEDRMELTGSPVALRSGVTVHRVGGSVDVNVRRGGGGVDLAISETGTLWFGMGSTNSSRREALWATRSGQVSEVVPGWADDFATLALSPDGTRLALSIRDAAGEQIWVRQLASSQKTLSKLTFQGVNTQPRWHPNGDRILFVASFVPTHNLRVVRADGSSASPAIPAQGNARNYAGSWSKQGDWLVLEHFSAGTAPRDISAVRSGADSSVVPLVRTQFAERSPSISPDGRWLLYEAPTNGIYEVYVKPFPNTASGHYQVSSGGGSNPKWSRDGREIFFANGNNELTRVAVVPGNSFGVADQRVLFSLRGVSSWDVAPDAQRFIMIRDREGKERNKLVVVENFFEELKARVPR